MLFSKPIECTESKVNPKGSYGLWVILMSQHKIILGKKCTFLVSDVFNVLLLFTHSGMSDSLWIHRLQHARRPCPSLSPRACSNSCPLNQWCHPTIASSVIPFFSCLNLSQHQSLFWVTLHIRWPKYWSFSFSVSPSSEHPWLISFRIDWFDLFEVQGTLKSFLQHHSTKASILKHSAFFMVQLSHPFRKTIALTRWTFVGKALSLLFNTLSRYVVVFLPWSKHLVILWLQSPSEVILEPQENKGCHGFHYFPIYLPQSDGTITLT